MRGAEGRDGPGIPSEATKAPSAPDLKLALRECSSASAHEGALGGGGWRVTYEPHPKRRSKALPFSSLGSFDHEQLAKLPIEPNWSVFSPFPREPEEKRAFLLRHRKKGGGSVEVNDPARSRPRLPTRERNAICNCSRILTWFDIAVVYNDNRRAILAMEKGTPGEQAFAEAFKIWKQ